MKTLAVIPARGGSKGLPGKNIKPLAGKPLIYWTLKAAEESKCIAKCVVSTDDVAIQKEVIDLGYECSFLRPASLAQDDTPSSDVIMHALDLNPGFDNVCMLQPTSPVRSGLDIDNAFDIFYKSNAYSCVSVMALEYTPYWSFSLNSSGLLNPLLGFENFKTRRQDLTDCFVLNGAIYITTTQRFRDGKSFITEQTVPYIMSKERSVDIDDLSDFEEAEQYFMSIKHGNIQRAVL